MLHNTPASIFSFKKGVGKATTFYNHLLLGKIPAILHSGDENGTPSHNSAWSQQTTLWQLLQRKFLSRHVDSRGRKLKAIILTALFSWQPSVTCEGCRARSRSFSLLLLSKLSIENQMIGIDQAGYAHQSPIKVKRNVMTVSAHQWNGNHDHIIASSTQKQLTCLVAGSPTCLAKDSWILWSGARLLVTVWFTKCIKAILSA